MKFIVTEKAMRPASGARECFYCQQPIGSAHKNECVLIYKKARIAFTIEYDIECPSYWDANQIEFHRNEGSWCSNNAVRELQKIIEKNENKECFCGCSSVECLSETISDPYLHEE